jgi:LysM repeat protein
MREQEMERLLMQLTISRLFTFSVLLPAAIMFVVSCGGDSADKVSVPSIAPTTIAGVPIPTATPFAVLPDPIIVTKTEITVIEQVKDDEPVAYIVVAGDTLSGIAERYDTSVDAIMELNALTNPMLIFVGQELNIPEPESLVSSSPSPDTESPSSESPSSESPSSDSPNSDSPSSDSPSSNPELKIYVVQPGDTALAIAFQFDISLEELAVANGTTVESLNNIDIGDELVIPSSMGAG